MKCLLVATDEPHESGRQLFRCKRSGCEGKMLENLDGNKLHPPNCQGWPLPHELPEWLKLFDVIGWTEAKVLLWQARGSPIDEIPEGVPRPVLTKPPAPTEGPGTELKKLLDSLGVTPTKGCQCQAVQDEMNRLGPEGCTRERERFIRHLQDAYDEATILTKMQAGVAAWWQGTPKTLAGLVDEAIRRSAMTPAPRVG